MGNSIVYAFLNVIERLVRGLPRPKSHMRREFIVHSLRLRRVSSCEFVILRSCLLGTFIETRSPSPEHHLLPTVQYRRFDLIRPGLARVLVGRDTRGVGRVRKYGLSSGVAVAIDATQPRVRCARASQDAQGPRLHQLVVLIGLGD